MYHPKMKKVKTVAIALVSIRFWHCVSSDCCSECQFESWPGKIEVSYRPFLDLQDHAWVFVGLPSFQFEFFSVG